MGRKLPKCHRSRRSTTTSSTSVHNREAVTVMEIDDDFHVHESRERGVPDERTCIALLQDPRSIEDSGLIVACSNADANTCSGFMLHM